MGTTRGGRGMTRTLALGVVMLGVVACAPESAPPSHQGQPTDTSNLILAAALVNMPTGVTAASLPDSGSQGAHMVAKFCGQACHGIPAPSSHSSQDWPIVLRRMWLRMSSLDTTVYHISVPSDGERAAILDYMLANALQVTAGNLPDAAGKAVFVEKCGACHGLPDVHQHSAEDWVAVVRRMNGRMQQLTGQGLSQDELQRIVLYLQKVTAKS
jgi:cytochrome c5